MFETNTASCGGFSGLSDSFAAALWSADYALSMASLGFSNALWHVGGSNQYYNVSPSLLAIENPELNQYSAAVHTASW